MIRILVLALILTGSAHAQMMPFAFWKPATSAFTPASLDSLKLWLRADAITGKSAGDTVGIWTASAGPNGVMLTDSKKPIYYADSIGGKPTLYYDGVDDAMLASPLLINGTTMTAFYVVKRRAYINNTRLSSLGSPNSNDYGSTNTAIIVRSITNATTIDGYRNNGARGANAGYPQGLPTYITSKWDGTNHTMYVAGTAGTPVASTGAFWGTGITVGGSYVGTLIDNWRGHVSEVIVYSTALSDTDRGKVEDYIKTKYGL